MASTPCILKHITLVEINGGAKYVGPIDMEGMESESPQGEVTTEGDCRYYICGNCLRRFDGEETFDECKAHLGSFPLYG